jgi:hypothetical protein
MINCCDKIKNYCFSTGPKRYVDETGRLYQNREADNDQPCYHMRCGNFTLYSIALLAVGGGLAAGLYKLIDYLTNTDNGCNLTSADLNIINDCIAAFEASGEIACQLIMNCYYSSSLSDAGRLRMQGWIESAAFYDNFTIPPQGHKC